MLMLGDIMRRIEEGGYDVEAFEMFREPPDGSSGDAKSVVMRVRTSRVGASFNPFEPDNPGRRALGVDDPPSEPAKPRGRVLDID